MSSFEVYQRNHGHPTQGPGFGVAPDAFAGISHNRGMGKADDEGYYITLKCMTQSS